MKLITDILRAERMRPQLEYFMQRLQAIATLDDFLRHQSSLGWRSPETWLGGVFGLRICL